MKTPLNVRFRTPIIRENGLEARRRRVEACGASILREPGRDPAFSTMGAASEELPQLSGAAIGCRYRVLSSNNNLVWIFPRSVTP